MKSIEEKKTIQNFGKEWAKFDQNYAKDYELYKIFNDYFSIFPKKKYLNKKKIGIDIGCGSGRWAKFVSKKVKKLYLVDGSNKAISVSKKNLKKQKNIKIFKKNVYNLNFKYNSFDFAYCLGVLHHTHDIKLALSNINKILKKGSPFLIYLYYSFENKSIIYKTVWRISDLLRNLISNLPFYPKQIICDFLALFVYFPFAKISKILNIFKIDTNFIPLHYYKDLSFYTMRTDALDRFGSKIEKRFSKKKIKEILKDSGFEKISFSKKEPFWCAICYKK